MMSSRYEIRLESPAAEALLGFTVEFQARFVVALRELETDPYLVPTGGFDWRESKAFKALERAGFDIRILKARQIAGWRVFYYVDDRRRMVLVKEVVWRDDDTYDIAAGHVRRLKQNYLRYWSGG